MCLASGFSWMRRLPRAAGFQRKLLDRVGQIHAVADDARVGESAVQYAPGRSDERRALPVLHVARLLADQHDLRPRWAGAEHRLRRALIQVAPTAVGRSCSQRTQATAFGYERRSVRRGRRHARCRVDTRR